MRRKWIAEWTDLRPGSLMAGAPLKAARKQVMQTALADAAIRWAAENKCDPKDYMAPFADKLYKMALDGEPDDPVTLGAIKEVAERYYGKVAQEIQVDRTETHGVDAGLVGAMQDLLRLAGKKTAPVLEKVINHEPLPSHLPEPTEPGPWEKP